MTNSAGYMLRAAGLGLAAGLLLTSCSTDDEAPNGSGSSSIEVPEVPEVTAQETGLAEAIEAELEVANTATLADQWPDLTAMATALAGTEDPDLCQQAGRDQYTQLVEAQPASVRAVIDPGALLDEHASGETVTVYYGNDQASATDLQEATARTDAQCVEEYESAIDHVEQPAETQDDVTVHTWQVVASDQLTGRMVDVVGENIFVRYAAAYPPQVIAEDLDESAAAEFNAAATERALAVFEAAAGQ